MPPGAGPPEPPAGYALVRLDSVDSTNAEGLRRAARGDVGSCWIWAGEQTAGRGRRGRHWESVPGNLYCTLQLAAGPPANRIAELGFVAAVALHDAVAAHLPTPSDLALKWPNDLLVSGAKTAGLLVESATDASGARPTAVVIGFGVNIASHPDAAAHAATHLADHGVTAGPREILSSLMPAMALWLEAWQAPGGFSSIREAWLQRALPPGSALRVRQPEGELEGRFAGLDDDGSLLLERGDGGTVRVLVGDVYARGGAAAVSR